MQILQWLFNPAAAQQPPRIVSNSTPITKKQCDHHEENKFKTKDIVILKTNRRGERRHVKRVEKSKLNCDDLLLFRFLQRKDVSRPFFYQTLNLKGLGSFFERRRDSEKTGKRSEEINGVSTLGGNKVLPLVDSVNHQLSDSGNKDGAKKKKRKGVSRMKELLRWSATAKVMNLKKGAVLKTAVDDDLVCDESPKISVRIGMEDYTAIATISKAYSTLNDDQIRCADTSISTDDLHIGIGSWITTDSECMAPSLTSSINLQLYLS